MNDTHTIADPSLLIVLFMIAIVLCAFIQILGLGATQLLRAILGFFFGSGVLIAMLALSGHPNFAWTTYASLVGMSFVASFMAYIGALLVSLVRSRVKRIREDGH